MSEHLEEALGIQELPVGSPEPAITPPEGMIVPFVERDGWTRKYLYRTSMGADGRPAKSKILIREIPPAPGTAPAPVLPFLSGPAEQNGDGLQVPANMMVRPMTVQLSGGRQLGRTGLGQAYPIGGGTLPAGQPRYPGDYPGVPNAPVVSPPAQAAAPAPEEPVCPDGPIQLKNGDFLAPDDPVTLENLCEIMPVIAEALEILKKNRGGAGGNRLGPVTVQGGIPGASQGVPTSMSPFASQQQGQTGGNGGGGWGGGGRGGPGPQGPQGQVGAGGLTDFITKTDGDFTAGPGAAFVVVPLTTINFTVTNTGVAHFLLQATLGATSGASLIPQSDQIGVRVDGVDYPLSTRLLHTFASGVGEFLIGQFSMLPLMLTPGAHQVDVVLRGLAPGEFGGAALGTVGGVCATPTVPLHLSVIHS
jgi:hypothetical protein